MVSEETYAAVVAENAQLRERVAQLETALTQALERVSELEAAKKGPPPFVKANVPERLSAHPSRARSARPSTTAGAHARRRRASRSIGPSSAHRAGAG